jgi:hypothetical protein
VIQSAADTASWSNSRNRKNIRNLYHSVCGITMPVTCHKTLLPICKEVKSSSYPCAKLSTMSLTRFHCLIETHAMKSYWRSGGVTPRILNFCIRWRWVARFTSRPLYPLHPLDRRLVGLRTCLDTVVRLSLCFF